MIFKLKRSTRILLSLALALAMILPHVDQPVAKAAGEYVYVSYGVEWDSSTSGYKIYDATDDVTLSLVKDASNHSVEYMTFSEPSAYYTLQNPSETGLRFLAWVTDPCGEPEIDRLITESSGGGSGAPTLKAKKGDHDYSINYVSNDKYLIFAKFTPSTPSSSTTYVNTPYYYYNVAFNANGGSGKMDGITMAAGSTLPLPACEFKGPKGSDFIGWEYDGKIYQQGEIVSFDRNKTYNATWGEKMILSGDPVWEWTPSDTEDTITDKTVVKAEVTVKYESSTNPGKRLTKTYDGNNIKITKDTSATNYTAEVVGVTDVFYESNDSFTTIKATDLKSVKKYGADVLYAPKVKWVTEWPDKWTKDTVYPEMKYKVTYISKKQKKEITTEPIIAKTTSDPATIAADQKDAYFIATADLSGYSTDVTGEKNAKDVVNKCEYFFPNAGKIGYARRLVYKGYYATWDTYLPGATPTPQPSTVTANTAELASDTTPTPTPANLAAPAATPGDPAPTVDMYYMTYGKSVEQPSTEAGSSGSSASKVTSLAPNKLDDTVIKPNVTLKKEVLFDGKVTKYTASFTTIDGKNIKDYKAYDTDPESETYGKQLSGIKIYGIEKKYDCTGSVIKPIPIVMDYDIDGGTRLKSSSDYSVKYSGKKVGSSTGNVKIISTNNYKTTTTVPFDIVKDYKDSDPKNIKYGGEVKKVECIDSFIYTGEVQIPERLSVTFKDKTVQMYEYEQGRGYVNENPKGKNVYINVSKAKDAGNGRIYVKGSDGKEVSKKFVIDPVNLSDASLGKNGDLQVQLPDGKRYRYTGTKIKPRVKVIYKGRELYEGDEYTVTYSNASKAGTVGTVSITGKGNFKGTFKNVATFIVDKYDISDVDPDKVVLRKCVANNKVEDIKFMYAVNEEGICFSKGILVDSVYRKGAKLEKNDVLSYGDELTIKLRGDEKAGMTGSLELTVTVATTMLKPKVSGFDTIFTGNPIEPDKMLNTKGLNLFENGKITVEQGNANLRYGIDFIVLCYEDNVKVSKKAKAILKGIGEYDGAYDMKFKITKKD